MVSEGCDLDRTPDAQQNIGGLTKMEMGGLVRQRGDTGPSREF